MTQSLKHDIMTAMRADAIPAGIAMPWVIQKRTFKKDLDQESDNGGPRIVMPAGTYTELLYFTRSGVPYMGDIVMHDFPQELRKHLDFCLKATGHVLVTGLGLGCVVRGLLANPYVRHVTVLEKSRKVMKLVYPYMPRKRITILRTDALLWVKQTRQKFDSCWHDLYTDQSAGEPHLAIIHQKLILDMCQRVKGPHGAWNFPRYVRRVLQRGSLPNCV